MSATIVQSEEQRQEAAYDRQLADIRKLMAESDEFRAERRKLMAEALRLERQRGLTRPAGTRRHGRGGLRHDRGRSVPARHLLNAHLQQDGPICDGATGIVPLVAMHHRSA